MNSSFVTKIKFSLAFSNYLTGLVVTVFFLSKRFPYFLIASEIRVCFPTPDGPTKIRGLYYKGVGLNGWKYSLAYTKISF